MWTWLKKLFIQPGALVLDSAIGRMPSLRFRCFSIEDVPACMALYDGNAPGRFPGSYRENYEKSLQEEAALVLIGEQDGEIVCCGGIMVYESPFDASSAALTFGLVAPHLHGQGFGTALLLARIGLLPAQETPWSLALTNVSDSGRFYERFGFSGTQSHTDEEGNSFPVQHVIASGSAIQACLQLFEEAEIEIPAGAEIPQYSPS